MTTSIVERISAELAAQPWQVEAAVALLDGGSTVPFVARYRKEATGALDDIQLRRLDERLRYLRELVLAMYLARHMRGAIVEAKSENEAYTAEELAGALIHGQVSANGGYLRVG